MEPALSLEQVKDKLIGSVAPRVTEDYIKSRIAGVEYSLHGITTICVITMHNGFKFFGHSTPASPENFDTGIGERYAYDNAFKHIWSHEGYLLREKLHEQEGH